MAFTSRSRLVNPRLGTYFGIFAAAFAAIVLMALMFEQLGVTDPMVRMIVFGCPVALYAALGLLSATRETQDYFACGRRVPAFFNGLALGIAALGGAGFLALTGCFFLIGFDALCLSIGWYAGLVFATLLFVPFLRKVGAYTVPTFLGRRFDSRTVRVVAAAVLSVPILLLLAAEARFAAYASAWLLGQSERLTAVLVVSCVAGIVIAGGMRSLTWSTAAQGIAALLALAVSATIVAVMVSNLPLPQMTHGNILRTLTRIETARNLPIIVAPNWGVELPGEGIEMLSKRMLQAFGNVGGIGFIVMSFVVATGIAASPGLLPRAGTAPGVYEARKSGGWAVLVVGLVLLTLPAVAVYLRSFVLEQVVNAPVDRLPVWFQLLQQAGIARIEGQGPLVGFTGVGFERDAVLFALPVAAGMPQVIVYLSLAGALAAAMAALAASMMAAAAILSEDVVHGLPNEPVADSARIGTTRLALLGVAFVTVWLAVAAPADPLQLFLWALTFSASASFPIILLAIWWKRANAWGALAGMATGSGVAMFMMLLSETGAITLPSVLAAAVGLPLAFAATIGVSLMTPAPGKHVLDMLRDVRVPGGETLYDREMRLQRLKNRTPGLTTG
jgi:cation/acetate symporter